MFFKNHMFNNLQVLQQIDKIMASLRKADLTLWLADFGEAKKGVRESRKVLPPFPKSLKGVS